MVKGECDDISVRKNTLVALGLLGSILDEVTVNLLAPLSVSPAVDSPEGVPAPSDTVLSGGVPSSNIPGVNY